MKHLSFAIVLVVFSFFMVAYAAQESAGVATDPQYSAPPRGTGNEAWTREQLEKMRRDQKVVRQKQLKDDTDKLLQLATELKTSVDKTNANVLSLDVVKKAEEIEKLAKHIKTNMRDEAR